MGWMKMVNTMAGPTWKEFISKCHSPLGISESALELDLSKQNSRTSGRKRGLCALARRRLLGGMQCTSTALLLRCESTHASVITFSSGHYSAFTNWLYNFLSS